MTHLKSWKGLDQLRVSIYKTSGWMCSQGRHLFEIWSPRLKWLSWLLLWNIIFLHQTRLWLDLQQKLSPLFYFEISAVHSYVKCVFFIWKHFKCSYVLFTESFFLMFHKDIKALEKYFYWCFKKCNIRFLTPYFQFFSYELKSVF